MQLLKNFLKYYGTQKVHIAIIGALHWSLSYARSIQSTPYHPTASRSILMLSAHIRIHFLSGHFAFGFTNNDLDEFLFSIHGKGPDLLGQIKVIILGEEFKLQNSLCSFLTLLPFYSSSV
jgi:hypothetical protein